MSSYYDSKYRSSNESKVYVGNLPKNIRERDLEDVFYKYGKIVGVDLKNTKGGPEDFPFAFVEFEDSK
jgi:RNA recognition motif-containing protein